MRQAAGNLDTTQQLILFDIDGTLLMGNGIGREATRRAMLDMFGTDGRLQTHHFGGKTDWYTLTEILDVPEADIAQGMTHYEQILARHMADLIIDFPITVLPGALEAVTHLRQRDDVILGIVTGNVSSTAPIKLQAAGFDPAWFPVGAFGSEALHRNDLPPLALARAVEHARCTIEVDCVTIIGDTVADIECARALGARAVAVTTGFSQRGALVDAKPDFLLDSLLELLPILV